MEQKNKFASGFKTLFSPGKESSRKIDLVSAMKMYYSVAAFGFVVAVLVSVLVHYYGGGLGIFHSSLYNLSSILPGIPYLHAVLYIIMMAVLFFLLIPIGLFINAAIYHAVGKFFLKAWNGGYEKTFVAVVFGEMPALFLFWLMLLPFVKLFAVALICVWEFVILTIALASQHKVDRVKSFAALLATLFIIVAIALLVIGVTVGSFYPYPVQ
ncbi:YIP1 family protein [Candidatus Marsarchaeota archaeon]|jgi:hypothetical protein|nr:YIP1 family protein [Candidatus Marsarchaeota archaeon]MCL5089551.1 YIP1 family protein [Candidatus Marsarchaeota archaeon]